jgi:hypothetical protein
MMGYIRFSLEDALFEIITVQAAGHGGKTVFILLI